MPASEWTLIKYVLTRFFTSKVQGDSMQTELYGIRQVHVLCGRRIEISSRFMPMLCRIMRTYKKLRPPGQNKKIGITSPVLHEMLKHLNGRCYDQQTLRAMLCFAKFGMLRVSEYTNGPAGDCPRVGDIRFIPDIKSASMLVYYFFNSKTNQFQDRERIVCVCQCPGPCAVHEVIKMLRWRKSVTRDQYLFQFSSGAIPTANVVNSWIRYLCQQSGMDSSRFSSHCLRAGGVQDLLTMGVSDHVVALLTRHKSMESLRPYKRLGDKSLGTVLSRFSEEELIFRTALAPSSN